MSNLSILLAIAGAVLVLGYLLLRFNSLWVYRFLDRALRNGRTSLPDRYQVPRYFVPDKDGGADMSVRWPGWDGWYFFVLPDDRNIPLKMIRASVMTGLYGLDGIDDYQRLSRTGLSSFEAIEYLTFVLDEDGEGRLSQHYLPKATSLAMERERLDVSVASGDGEARLGAAVRGAWPDYAVQVENPRAGLELDLRFRGDKIEWWADIPGVFTYFSAFGTFDGRIACKPSAPLEDAGGAAAGEGSCEIRGVGGFEHGFARKPFNFDALWLPVKGLKAVLPGFNPVRYHYEVFICDDRCRGGFMKARGFGIDFRNRGGVHLNGAYRPIHGVKIRYLDLLEPEQAGASGPREGIYRQWEVRARTDDGVFAYVATLETPPARVTDNMMYYGFSFEGSYQGRETRGRGYGEYLRI